MKYITAFTGIVFLFIIIIVALEIFFISESYEKISTILSVVRIALSLGLIVIVIAAMIIDCCHPKSKILGKHLLPPTEPGHYIVTYTDPKDNHVEHTECGYIYEDNRNFVIKFNSEQTARKIPEDIDIVSWMKL